MGARRGLLCPVCPFLCLLALRWIFVLSGCTAWELGKAPTVRRGGRVGDVQFYEV